MEPAAGRRRCNGQKEVHMQPDTRSRGARAARWLALPPVDGPAWTLLLRLMGGSVFLWEGILKFLYPNLGVGRFVKLGFPAPAATAHFVALVEIVGGLLLVGGLLTRVVAIAFVIEMLVAMLSTKIGIYRGTSPLLPATLPRVGLAAVLHEIRSEWAQLATAVFVLATGPGRWSLDAVLRGARRPHLALGAPQLAHS
jgi:uncharacterized membrane protein YphA (DoxX/SURF4 family)